jgi:hypothetical protein
MCRTLNPKAQSGLPAGYRSYAASIVMRRAQVGLPVGAARPRRDRPCHDEPARRIRAGQDPVRVHPGDHAGCVLGRGHEAEVAHQFRICADRQV